MSEMRDKIDLKLKGKKKSLKKVGKPLKLHFLSNCWRRKWDIFCVCVLVGWCPSVLHFLWKNCMTWRKKQATHRDRNFLTCLISHFYQCISQQELNLPLIPMLKDFPDKEFTKTALFQYMNLRGGLCLRIMTFSINGSRDGVSMMRIIIILSGIYSTVKRHLELLLYEHTSCLGYCFYT